MVWRGGNLNGRSVPQVRKNNSLKDFVAVAGPLGVTHFLVFSKSSSSINFVSSAIPRGLGGCSWGSGGPFRSGRAPPRTGCGCLLGGRGDFHPLADADDDKILLSLCCDSIQSKRTDASALSRGWGDTVPLAALPALSTAPLPPPQKLFRLPGGPTLTFKVMQVGAGGSPPFPAGAKGSVSPPPHPRVCVFRPPPFSSTR